MTSRCTHRWFRLGLAGLLFLSAGSVAVAAEAGGVLTREGAYWVKTETGSLRPTGALKIRTRGPVTVSGGASTTTYTLKTRVKAGSEREARRLLSQWTLRNTLLRDVATLTLTWPEHPVASAEMEVRTTGGSPLYLETWSGDVQVYDIRSDVFAKTGAGIIQMDRIAGQVEARTAGGNVRLGKIGGGVRCFSGGGTIEVDRTGGESWFETAGGDVLLSQVGGAAHASTAGGNIRIGRAGGAVIARSAGGRIEVGEAGGAVVAANSGGSIQVGQAKGVRLEATGGSIRLRGSSGALRAVSDVGSILAELIPGVLLQDSALSTGRGDITVFLPSNIALTVRALNESDRIGRIVSEFPEILVKASQQQSRQFAEGALNGGGPVLQLTSTGGTIYLRRLKQ